MSEMINLEKLIEYQVRSWNLSGIPCSTLLGIRSQIERLASMGWNVEAALKNRGLPKESYNQETFRPIVFPYHSEDAVAHYFAGLYPGTKDKPPALTAVFANAQEKYRVEMTNLRKTFEYEVRKGAYCLTLEDMLRDIESLKDHRWDIESLLEAQRTKGVIPDYLPKKDYTRKQFFEILTGLHDFDHEIQVARIWGELYSDVWEYNDIGKYYTPVYLKYDSYHPD